MKRYIPHIIIVAVFGALIIGLASAWHADSGGHATKARSKTKVSQVESCVHLKVSNNAKICKGMAPVVAASKSLVACVSSGVATTAHVSSCIKTLADGIYNSCTSRFPHKLTACAGDTRRLTAVVLAQATGNKVTDYLK